MKIQINFNPPFHRNIFLATYLFCNNYNNCILFLIKFYFF
ncbi:hypothetical protein D1BOALGB6SA_4954 [Olavius sp. associated proteobacterium Delta 1]|nr:hypothetical protein D1BOALGB6SA_4954 [Olavius sp. associated proteobacterium Delta 1]